MKALKSKIKEAIHQKFPFVLFRKPGEDNGTSLFQVNSEIDVLDTETNSDGFVFAPFDNADKGYIIKDSLCDKIEFTVDYEIDKNSSFIVESNQQSNHLKLVEKTVNYIQNSEVQKVVVSRKEKVNMGSIELESIYSSLLQQYPNAFVYCWFHPETGIWMGATPERLLKVTESTFEVMALAATQEFNGSLNVEWGEKELREHQIVVDYITKALKENDLHISDTYTVKAGGLLHLRADIKGMVKTPNNIQKLVSLIHPTPATCGLPKEQSKQFVLKNENYNREFYTGYLGDICGDTSDLFVNLRCMKIDLNSNSIAIYVGGGITKDSIPQKEWEETVAKSKVMKKVL